MPQLRLMSYTPFAPIPVDEPNGNRLLIPRIQFRCWVRLPNVFFPRDGIVDTGSPFTWFPEEVWQTLRPGIDYEWLPFASGYSPRRAQTAGWNFTYRMARLLQPIGPHDMLTELTRSGIIAQFADGNSPIPTGSQRPAVIVLGLWAVFLKERVCDWRPIRQPGNLPELSNGSHLKKCSRPSSELSISSPHSPTIAPGKQQPCAMFTTASTHASFAMR